MLKWAVQNSRPSYLPEQYDEDFCETPIKLQQECRCLLKCNYPNMKRKSLTFRRRCSYGGADKENLCQTQLTSTPLSRVSSSTAIEHDLKHIHSLKDLSNIMPDGTIHRTNTSTSTIVHTTPVRQLPTHYASTLPTFDAEYSPCGLIPGPLLALRGIGIPDSYFEKPRYFNDNIPLTPSPPPPPPLNESTANILLEEKPLNVWQEPAIATATSTVADDAFIAVAAISEHSTLSSTKMGDVTLERMIDALLASTRKEPTRRRKPRRFAYTRHHHPFSMQRKNQTPEVLNVAASPSPTYRPAYDPASDLSEYWRPDESATTTTEFAPCYGYQEGEISTSSPFNQVMNQHGLPRKRQIARRISTSVRQSAQKLFGVTSSSSSSSSRSVGTTQPRNISPDSGHNSTSDYDDK